MIDEVDMIVWVVCNANGECLGVFATETLAKVAADGQGAYISEHKIINSLEKQVRINYNNKRF